ncbi:MAG: HEAT repeat domain-containing protein [Planctomycetes bacterium]|nr:HEAT repeat domain-containing protein [Planctomycetota bacterium]
MQWLKSLFKKPDKDATACFEEGRSALDRHDFDLAISWFNACIRQAPQDSLGFFGRGFAQLKKGEFDQAIADLSEAIRLRPENAYSYYYRSLCYSGKGRQTLEAADLERALQLGAEVADAENEKSPEKTTTADEIIMALRAALHEAAEHDMDNTVRALAGKAISQLDQQAPSQIPALLTALRHSEPEIRFGAAQALGDAGKAAQSAVPALLLVLQDRHPGVRLQAARALWLIDRQVEAALPVLIEAVQQDDELLVWIAADCLGEMGPCAQPAQSALGAAWNRDYEISHVKTGLKLALDRISGVTPV